MEFLIILQFAPQVIQHEKKVLFPSEVVHVKYTSYHEFEEEGKWWDWSHVPDFSSGKDVQIQNIKKFGAFWV